LLFTLGLSVYKSYLCAYSLRTTLIFYTNVRQLFLGIALAIYASVIVISNLSRLFTYEVATNLKNVTV